MISLSDSALRRLAWAVSVFLVAMIAVRVGIDLTDGARTARSWKTVFNEFGFFALALIFPLTGALIVRRQPRNTIGWLLEGIGLVWGLGGFAENYVRFGLEHPGSMPGPGLVAVLGGVVWVPAIGLMGTFLILLYPDGRLPAPGWRPLARLSALTILALTVTLCLTPGRVDAGPGQGLTNPLGFESATPVLAVMQVIFLALLPLCIVSCAAALVRRFRRSSGIERQQLKWLATAGAVVAFLFLLVMAYPWLVDVTSSGETPAWAGALDALSLMSFALLPVAIGVAILRHGLYEIDVIINRSLVYGFLTATLAGVYLGSVLLLQLVVSPLTDRSDLAVAGSTLTVAALFRPARARIQSTVDRRFYRSRYDAVRTVDAFVARLRHEVDLDAVGSDLTSAANETVQPAHVSLWLRP